MNLSGLPSSDPALARSESIKTLLAAIAFLLVLTSTSMLRPIRDQVSTALGEHYLPYLFTSTFVFTLLAVPLFGLVVKVCPRNYLVGVVFGAMIASMSFFYMTFSFVSSFSVNVLFFSWLSSFNLIVISLFWSAVSDSFSTQEAKRRYGYIAIGGTLGAILGPAATGHLVKKIDVSYLFLITMGCLSVATCCLTVLRAFYSGEENKFSRPIGGSIFAGMTLVFRNPMLAGIAGLVICYSSVSTVLYADLTQYVKHHHDTPAEQAAFFSRLDLMVNSLALCFQLLGTRAVLRWIGVRWSLTLAPAMLAPTLLWFGLSPSTLGYSIMQVLNRSFEFSFSKPGREVLFTTVDTESRYKAKNFIDTLVYRSSDSLIVWINKLLGATGQNTILILAFPAALCWLIVAQLLTFAHSNIQKRVET